MHFRFFIIFSILVSFLLSQAQLNRALGEELFFGSARSYAMGTTHSTNSNTSSLVRYNPSLLKSVSNNKALVDFQANLSNLNERRSILGQDSFGDFLTMMDYVNNSNNYAYFQGGLVFDANSSIAIGISWAPLCSFNYDYLEEVRGSANYETGDIVIRDNLEGYHKFNSSGVLNIFSTGLSYSILDNKDQFNFGLGFHKLLNTAITDQFDVDSITTDIDNLSSANDYESKSQFKNLGLYYSLGSSFISDRFILSWSFEPDFLIQNNNYNAYNFIDSLGVISYLDSTNTNFILEGLNYYKPEKLCFGLSYNPKDNSDLIITAEFEFNKFYKYSYLEDTYIYRFGFEYILPSDTPIRSGLIYKQSPLQLVPDQSIITFGTGGHYRSLLYDIALSYTFFDYYYPTIFVVDEDSYDSFDKVIDSKLNFVFSFRYLLK